MLLLTAYWSHYWCTDSLCALSELLPRLAGFASAASIGIVIDICAAASAMTSTTGMGHFITGLYKIVASLGRFWILFVLLLFAEILFFVINQPNDPHFSLGVLGEVLSDEGTDSKGNRVIFYVFVLLLNAVLIAGLHCVLCRT